MPRLILALVGLVALMAAVPSAAQVGGGLIAYTTEGYGMFTVRPDGSDLELKGFDNAHMPRWSPDGSKYAFIQFDQGDQVQLEVVNADNSDWHVVATDEWTHIRLSTQPWSPDGSRIAWGPGADAPGGDIYTASAAGGDVRRISTDGRQKEPPVWSPTGSQLVYASSMPDPTAAWRLFSARDDGSAPVEITQGSEPSWSPDGASIAFVKTVGGDDGIYVAHADGTEPRHVASFTSSGPYFHLNSDGRPAWSPDGSRIAYTSIVPGPSDATHRQEISVANADGSGVRRLTGLTSPGTFNTTPTWSPDGDRIVFIRVGKVGQLWTMNPDGTCQSPIALNAPVEQPSWQAVPGGPAIGRKGCPAALALVGATTPHEDGSSLTINGTIANGGTEPLRNVVLTITAPGHDLGFGLTGEDGCTQQGAAVVCQFDRIGGGESQDVGPIGTARRVGRDLDSRDLPLRVRLHVTAHGSLHATRDLLFKPSRCETYDAGSGRIYGTRFADRICGRRGADDIHPGRGRDYVTAGAGPDVIYARDGYRDVIFCGPGRDLVIADRKDKVSGDCERVRRA